jgi:polysaccharide biosynthesis transport protein
MASNPTKSPPASPAFSLGAIVFVLFKHKWKIVLLSILSFGAAITYYLRTPPVYLSQAKILVTYVKETDPDLETTSPVSGRANESQVKAETEILKSWNLAERVVAKIGPERFGVAKEMFPKAVGAVVGGLTATAEKGGNVILVTYQHSDPVLTQMVVDELVRQYFVKHREIHRSAGSLTIIEGKVTDASTALGVLENELKELKGGSTLPLADLSASFELERAKVKDELDSATVSYAEQEAWVAEVKKFVSGAAPALSGTERPKPDAQVNPPGTIQNTPANAGAGAGPVVDRPSAEISPRERDSKITLEYENVLNKLTVLQANRSKLSNYTAESSMVREFEARLKAIQEQRLNLERKYPYLLATQPATAGAAAQGPRVDLMSEQGKLVSLDARIKALTSRLATVTARNEQLAKNAPIIARKERERESKQKSFEHFSSSQAKAENNAIVPSQKMPGLGMIEEATPAKEDSSLRNKISLGIAMAGPALGIALVLLFGLLLNRTIKRPSELEEHIGVPLMMTIPFFNGRARRRLSPRTESTEKALALGRSAPWREGHFIRPFADSIRDRLGLYFERNKLTHKPKLIGVTGFLRGTGVSTLAGGLAAGLSEVGDGRVLLVDMNVAKGKAHSFSEGLPVITLKNALNDGGKMESTSDNLYLARAEAPDSGAGSLLLKKLFELLPNLKSSDFDYIVFDLPLLGQTSPAAAMGGLMDSVLMVVEAEATPREEVKRGHRDLIASGANVSMIFNKARTYGPKALVGGV